MKTATIAAATTTASTKATTATIKPITQQPQPDEGGTEGGAAGCLNAEGEGMDGA